MLEITKSYILDKNKKPVAVQIPIAEFEQIEEIIENYGLARLMEEVENDQTLSKQEALNYFNSLKIDIQHCEFPTKKRWAMSTL